MNGFKYFAVILAILPVLTLGKTNLAAKKPTKQSTTGWSGSSSRAVDGKKSTNYYAHSCTHTLRQSAPWWRVDLQGQYIVDTVRITNRGDCCGSRLSGFNIYVGNTVYSGGPGNAICASDVSIKQGKTMTIQCKGGATGRYVFIRIPGKGKYLTLCEVEVYGCKKGKTNLAAKKPTKQSTTGWSGSSSRAVDGKKSTNYYAHSCTHTLRQSAPWWRVDLQGQYLVDTVRITNRGDCCGSRLSGFNIYVGNTAYSGGPGNAICASNVSIKQGKTMDIQCKRGATGRYVFIRIPGKWKYLTLCEVEVYGCKENRMP